MMTGEQYKASLHDGRATYFEGERIDDLMAHPLFAKSIEDVAADYDRFYKPEPGAVSDYMTVPGSADELRSKVEQHHEVDLLTHVTYASIMTLLTAADRVKTARPQAVDAINWFVKHVQDNDLRITECITDAKGDRSRKPGQQDDPDAYLHVVERRPDGVVIRGAKLHISCASTSHELLVIPTKAMHEGEEDYAIACAVPANAPGVKIVNTMPAPRNRDPRDFPVSSNRIVPEGFVIFDNVFVPNERIFLDGETAYAAVFAHSLGLWERLGGLASLVDGADLLVGLAQLIAEANGLEKVGHIKEKISEMIINATLIRACLEAAIAHSEVTSEGAAFPNELFTNAGKYHGAANYSLMVRHLHDIGGGSILTVPSMSDLDNPDTGHLLRKYLGTKQSVDGIYRAKLFHAIRDLTADSYGGYKAVSTIQAGGGLYAQRIVTRNHYNMKRAKALALEAAGLAEAGHAGLKAAE